MRADIVTRALACVGVRFRPQGRDPAYGLDCVGLIAWAGRVPRDRVPGRYRLRGGTAAGVAARIDAAGLRRIAGPGMPPGPGDVVLAEAGPWQFHLIVLTADGFVHADAGIGRVVAVPGAVPWPVRGGWAFEGE